MEFTISRTKLTRRILLWTVVILPWVLCLDLAGVWMVKASHLLGTDQAPIMKSPVWFHLFSASFLLCGMGLLAVWTRATLRLGFRLVDGTIHFVDQSYSLAGPTYLDRGNLIITTDRGPLVLGDDYTVSLHEIREKLGGEESVDAWMASQTGTLRDFGIRWRPSAGWFVPLLFVLMLLKGHLEAKNHAPEAPVSIPSDPDVIHALEVGFQCLLAFAAAFLVIPWLLFTAIDPSRRHPRWVFVSPEYLVFVNDTVRIIPICSIQDLGPVPGKLRWRDLGVTCKNGRKYRFPDLSLEREAAVACGLDPDRFIPLRECAARLGCSQIRAWWVIQRRKELMRSGNIRRAAFEEALPQLLAAP